MPFEVLALLAASAFVLGNVLQQKGTFETLSDEDDPHLLVQVFLRPVWLDGGGLQMCGGYSRLSPSTPARSSSCSRSRR